MKLNPIVSEIIRGQWLLDPHNIEMYYPMIEELIKGNRIDFKSTYQSDSSALSILDVTGKPIIPVDGQTLEIPKNSIAQVKMIGEVVKYGDLCVTGADEIAEQLYAADSYKNVDATIFKVDGPGGSVKAIGPLMEFAKNKTKPVIGLADDALSLHYWALVGVCDYIIADNDISSRFGSVGVVSSFMDNKDALEKLGYKFHEIYPNESEHKNLAFRLAREGKYDMIKEENLTPLAIKFQEAVKANRPNLKTATGVLTGKVFYADEALDLGMIDAIGDINLAMEMARKLSFKNNIKNFIQ